MVNGANPFKLYALNGSGRLTDALDGEGATRLAKAIMNAKAEASHKSCTHTTIGGFPFLRDCDAKRRVPHASPRGLRAPAGTRQGQKNATLATPTKNAPLRTGSA